MVFNTTDLFGGVKRFWAIPIGLIMICPFGAPVAVPARGVE